jgi:L-iditol 2-dehydrogenase
MRAVRVGAPGTVELVEVPRPAAKPGERLVRVAAAAVCATDRKLAARGSDPPVVPGHEAAGWLEDGTPVGIHPDTACGVCAHCRAGFGNRCARRVPLGLVRDGGLAEWVAVPEAHLVPLEGVDPRLAPLLEPLACCLHAVRLLGVVEGERALVVGAGAMGVLSAWALAAHGAAVGVVQRSQPRRAQAAELGVGVVLAPEEDPAAMLGGPPSVAVVTAPGGEALTWTLEHLEVGGRAHAFAGSPGGAPVDANLVHYQHLTLLGSTGSDVGDHRTARDLVAAGTVPLDRLPRTVIGLAEAPAALTAERERRALKVVVEVAG